MFKRWVLPWMRPNWRDIKLLALDFDGTLTDGYVYVDENGKETVRCSRKDGLGIELLKAIGVDVIVLSKETNKVVESRCLKLGITCVHSLSNGQAKKEKLQEEMHNRNLSPYQVAFMGDDINDLEAVQFVGIGIVVADGHTSLKYIANYVTSRAGGSHAVREICDLILLAKVPQ